MQYSGCDGFYWSLDEILFKTGTGNVKATVSKKELLSRNKQL